jgi:hypothetical protein
MATRMQQRRGTANQWISTNQGNGPILSPGEIGFESDTNKFKIGDGVNHWVDLTYFTDAESAITALTGLVDGAPDLLNTLNELAAAIGDDPAFITTVATNLSNHQSDTTNIHGIADTSILVTTSGTQTLTNKTLTTPTINGPTITAIGQTPTIHGIYLPDTHNIIFEGSIANDFETTLQVINPTADRTVSLPDASGTVALTSDIAGLATESYVDTAVGNVTVDLSTAAGTGLDWTGTQFEVDTAIVFANPTISSGLTLDGTGDFTVSADANIILDATTEVYIGSAASGNEVATKSYADAAAAAIVASAPETLNTLNELAEAINDDASYAATITTALGLKAPLANPTFTGTVDLTGATVTGLPASGADEIMVIMGAY